MNELRDLQARKAQLLKAEEAYKKSIEVHLTSVQSTANQVGRITLIAGIAGIGAILISKLFFRRKQKDIQPSAGLVTNNPKQESFIVRNIKQQIALFLISIAKQRLIEFLINTDRLKENPSSNEQS